jgi:hypothetical protein
MEASAYATSAREAVERDVVQPLARYGIVLQQPDVDQLLQPVASAAHLRVDCPVQW